jgi:hypothetical protein
MEMISSNKWLNKGVRMSTKVVCKTFYSVLIGLTGGLSSLPVLAQNGAVTTPLSVLPPSDSSVYWADFFNQYSPQNALEMIERLPGFSFDQGSDARGFGGNAGNVLIDGSRPTSKSSGLRGALIRIPAQQVIRIEILRGGVSAGEAAGQSIVANVIRSNTGTSGTWALKARQTAGTGIKPNLEATISTQLGEWDTSFDTDIGGSPEFRSALIDRTDKDDQLQWTADEDLKAQAKWAFFNGEVSREVADGKLTLNGRLGGDGWSGDFGREIYDQRPDDNGVPDRLWTLNERNKFRVAELGVDWARTDDEYKLRLIGLGLVNDRSFAFNLDQQDSQGIDSFGFTQDRLKTEFVGRATYGRVSGSAFKPEYGFEIANNRLDTDASETDGTTFTPVSGSNAVIEEWRGELFATFVYEVSEKLSIEGGLTGEFSQIEVTGDSSQKQTFEFIKPRLSSTYKFDDDTRVTFEAKHRVGQLDFTDFAFSSNGSDAQTTSGNPNLSPDQTTEVKTTFDWSYSERGSLKVEAFYEWRKDILEQVLLSTNDNGTINQGLGNVGDATFWGIVSELNLPLDYVLPNGLLELKYRHRRSSFDDTVGGERTVNDYTPNWLSFEFRQDLIDQQMAWGLEYWGSFTDINYRVDQRETFQGNKRLRFFVETTRYFGVKTQLEVTHLNTGRYTRSRFFFDGTRDNEPDGAEVSSRQRRPELKLSMSGTF